MHKLIFEDMTVEINYKKIKNIYLYVQPPKGNIKISAPKNTPEKSLKSFIASKLHWIKKQKHLMSKRKQFVPKNYTHHEEHYFQGQKYQLHLIENNSATKIQFIDGKIKLYSHPKASQACKEQAVNNWYRIHIKSYVAPLIAAYEKQMGVSVNFLGVKKMKTRWGSCNINAKRVWLNLDLAKKPPLCLEYVLVHEMVHLLEPSHNHRFKSLMTRYMPDWKNHKKVLDAGQYN